MHPALLGFLTCNETFQLVYSTWRYYLLSISRMMCQCDERLCRRQVACQCCRHDWPSADIRVVFDVNFPDYMFHSYVTCWRQTAVDARHRVSNCEVVTVWLLGVRQTVKTGDPSIADHCGHWSLYTGARRLDAAFERLMTGDLQFYCTLYMLSVLGYH